MSVFFGPPAFVWSCKMRSLPASFGLLAALVALSTAQIPFGPVFPVSQYVSDEGGQQLIHLSANILTSHKTPSFNGSIEVDITADDPPSKNAAELESDYIVNLHNTKSRTFTVVFQSQQANSTEHVIPISEDDILEGDETFRLRIVAARFMGQAADIFTVKDGLTNTFADVIIEDDDFVSVSWTIAQPIEVTEGYEVEVRLRAQAFGLYENPIEVGVVCAAATSTGVEPALPGRDYSFTVGTKLKFTDVETFSSLSWNDLVIPIIDDDIAEPCESFICTLQGGAQDAVRGSEPNQVTIRISDDDYIVHNIVPVSFSQANYSVLEGERSTTITLKALADHTFSFSVTVSTRDGTASSTADYSHKRSSLTFEAGVNLITFTVTIHDEGLAEPTEEFYIDLESLSSSAVIKGCPSSATVYILDDDSIEVTFNPTQYSVSEGDGDVVLTLLASQPASFDYTVHVDTVKGTAVGGLDFQSGGYQVTFLAGETTASVSIHITDDTTAELSEDFSAVLAIPATAASQGITKGAADTATIDITDNDPVEVVFNPTQYTVNKGDGVVTLTLNADRPASFEYTVEVLTQNGTAIGGNDYAGEGFSVAFPIGDTVISFNITIVDDDVVEESEHFSLHLEISDEAASSGITKGTQYATANVTIVNDDGSWSPWLKGSCSTLPCGGVGVRTDVRLCTSPTPNDGRVHCRGEQWRNTTCFTCPCGGGWSSWSEGVCSKKRQGQRVRKDSRICTTPDHPECCFGLRTRNSPCPAVHGGWSSWLEVSSCSVSCGGGTMFLVRECNEPVPAHGGKDCDGVPYRVERCNTCPCDAGWSSWVPGACGAPCGQNGTAIATRKCRGPPECCPGEGKRTEVCTSPPCQGR